MYSRTIALKRINPNLKVLLAVGGWNMGAEPFSKIVHSESNRKIFIESTIKFLIKNRFDGFDLE